MQSIAGLILAIAIAIFGLSYWFVLGVGALFAWGAYAHNSEGGAAMGLIPMAIVDSGIGLVIVFVIRQVMGAI